MSDGPDSDNVIPIRPQPTDPEISKYLSELFLIDEAELGRLGDELKDAKNEFKERELPENFAYGQLLNKLRATKKEEIVHMLAAAMWGEVLSDERHAQER